jgi:hypothetical protein
LWSRSGRWSNREKFYPSERRNRMVKQIEKWAFLYFFGAFAKFRKATISFVMPICQSVRPHGMISLPLVWFFMRSGFFFLKSAEKTQVSWKSDCTQRLVYGHVHITVHKDLCTVMCT